MLTSTWTLSEDRSYKFYLTAYSDNPTDNSTAGNTISVSTGHAAETDNGSATFTFNASNTGSYRSADGWAWLGDDVAQGYYTSSYGAYTGVVQFSGGSMKSAIDNYGSGQSGRWDNCAFSTVEIYATRKSGSGSGGAVPIDWYTSTATPGSGGAPSRSNGPRTSSPSGVAGGSSDWFTLPSSCNNWPSLIMGSGDTKSVAMYSGSASDYSIYAGSSFKMRFKATWSWTTVPYKGPRWSG